MSKRSPGSAAAMKAGQATHRKERDRHREKMARKYQMYCDSVVADYPDGTVIPSSFDVWMRFNKAMDKEIDGIHPTI